VKRRRETAAVWNWLGLRLYDAARWPMNLLRDLPRRMGRLVGLLAVVAENPKSQIPNPKSQIPNFKRYSLYAFWLHPFICYLFDLVGGPEIAQFFLRLVTETRPLTVAEVAAAEAVLGPKAVRYGEVRLAHDGVLTWVFRVNGNRAFTAWHTVAMPRRERTSNAYFALVVHELTHVYQYERVGTVYIGQALHSQSRMGREAYHYGGKDGLAQARAAGKRYSDYNREQQGQIAQDYHARLHAHEDVTAYEPFIAELREGRF
jgi:hypothetical protein